MQYRNSLALSLLIFTVLVCATAMAQTQAPITNSPSGFVYVMTNQATGNTVVQFQRALSGQLTRLQEVSTHGTGTGLSKDSLASQDSLVLSSDGQLLLAANAGSNEISVLSAGASGLQFLSKVSSGGTFPNSLAMNGNLVYVLNAKGTPSITGYRLSNTGTLTPIPNSTHVLPGGVNSAPSDVKFSQDGTLLLVPETATNQIDVFPVDNTGLASDGVAMPSSGKKPFALNFATRDRLLVTEVGPPGGSSAVSSYTLSDTNGLEAISTSVPDQQNGACWIAVTNDKSYAFISNTASGTISSYKIDPHGTVTLANKVAGVTTNATSFPIDSALSDDNRYLYVEESTAGTVVIFGVSNGALTNLGTVGGLPVSIQGIAAQ